MIKNRPYKIAFFLVLSFVLLYSTVGATTVAYRIKKDPFVEKKVNGYLSKARKKYENRNYAEANALAEKALLWDSTSTETYNLLGDMERMQVHLTKSVQYYSSSIKYDSSNYEVFWLRAYCFSELGKFKAAIDDYSRAINICPIDQKEDLASLYVNKGYNYNMLGRYGQAISNYKKALAYDSKYSRAYLEIGATFEDKKEYQKAIDAYGIAAKFYKQDKEEMAHLNCNMGWCKVELGKYDEALKNYEIGIGYSPHNADLFRHRGACYSKKKEYQKAIEDYNQAIKYYGNDSADLTVAYNSRGWNLNKIGKTEEAILDFNTAIAYHSENGSAYWNRGSANSDKKLYEEAIRDYSKAISIFKDSETLAVLFCDRSDCYSKIKKFDLACKDGDSSLVMVPDNRPAYTTLGYAYLYAGRFADSKIYFFKALAKDSSFIYNYYNLSCYYSLSGNKESALVWLDKAFKHGYDDFEHIAKDEDLNAIKDDEKFKQLLAKYKK